MDNFIFRDSFYEGIVSKSGGAASVIATAGLKDLTAAARTSDIAFMTPLEVKDVVDLVNLVAFDARLLLNLPNGYSFCTPGACSLNVCLYTRSVDALTNLLSDILPPVIDLPDDFDPNTDTEDPVFGFEPTPLCWEYRLLDLAVRSIFVEPERDGRQHFIEALYSTPVSSRGPAHLSNDFVISPEAKNPFFEVVLAAAGSGDDFDHNEAFATFSKTYFGTPAAEDSDVDVIDTANTINAPSDNANAGDIPAEEVDEAEYISACAAAIESAVT